MTRDLITHYFDGEGREFMQDCIRRAAQACVDLNLRSLVIFTGTGEGPHFAARELLPIAPFQQLRLVAVTPPWGRQYRMRPGDKESPIVRAGINPAMRDELESFDVAIVTAHLPFKEVYVGTEYRSDWARVAEAYGVLGGGFAYCVQAVMLACDAGAIPAGDRVVVASADTSFVAIASRTETFLSAGEGMLVEHIVCRPLRYNLSKPYHYRTDREIAVRQLAPYSERAQQLEQRSEPPPKLPPQSPPASPSPGEVKRPRRPKG